MYILSILYKRIYSYFLMPCYHYFENKNWCKIYIKVVWRGHLAEGEIVCSCEFSIIREKVASSTLCSLLFSTATLSALSLAFKVHAPTPEVVCFIPSCGCVCGCNDLEWEFWCRCPYEWSCQSMIHISHFSFRSHY